MCTKPFCSGTTLSSSSLSSCSDDCRTCAGETRFSTLWPHVLFNKSVALLQGRDSGGRELAEWEATLKVTGMADAESSSDSMTGRSQSRLDEQGDQWSTRVRMRQDILAVRARQCTGRTSGGHNCQVKVVSRFAHVEAYLYLMGRDTEALKGSLNM